MLKLAQTKNMIKCHCKPRLNTESKLENALRTLVTPPIKGEITKGKLQWRGVKLVHDYWNLATHVMQRGELITTVKTTYGETLIFKK